MLKQKKNWKLWDTCGSDRWLIWYYLLSIHKSMWIKQCVLNLSGEITNLTNASRIGLLFGSKNTKRKV